MKYRNESLDALRGYAILTMILSGSIAYADVLPAWMYHAQVPPPDHVFNPSIPGITWVDLVFPFFLFSMGAAIPLSLKKHLDSGNSFLVVLKIAVKRFMLLAFFALFSQHMKAWVIAEQPAVKDQLLSVLAFMLLFFQFYDNKSGKWKYFFITAKVISFITAILLLYKLPFWGGKGFDWYHSDIIIMVLANMAFFGTLVYYFTAGKPLLRIALLPFIMAVFLAAKEPVDGWAKELFNFNHIGLFSFDWLYKFYFLKYLFIIIPGTIAGEWFIEESVLKKTNVQTVANENILAMASLVLVVLNLYCLFNRVLLMNLLLTTSICLLLLYRTRRAGAADIYRRLLSAGTYLLLLGLFFEAYEGGIKKDSSTYSYYFVTGGLAFFALILFNVMQKRKYIAAVSRYFSLNGKNPMVAYVAGNLLLLPLMNLTGTKIYWDAMNQNAWIGFLKGVLFTGLVSLITIFFVKRKWFWKT